MSTFGLCCRAPATRVYSPQEAFQVEQACGRAFIYVGLSNGALAATYAAARDPRAKALLLISGLPSPCQDPLIDDLVNRGVPVVLTAGGREENFGGFRAMQELQ
jgi:pimeloyl-ACP methyl ester carboxylesterase